LEQGVASSPAVFLELHYLIAPYTQNSESDQKLLGKIMQIFAENPTLPKPIPQGKAIGNSAELKIIMEPFSIKDLNKLWTMLRTPFKLSVSYIVSPVRVKTSQPKEIDLKNTPEYSAPGVYVEEVEMGAKPIEGVNTNTAGMVGVAKKGPLNKPTLITSFSEYQRIFGGYLDKSYGDYLYLPHAIEGFFLNGGRRVYITRVPVEETAFPAGRKKISERNRVKLVSDEAIIGKDSEEPSERTGLCSLKNIDDIGIIAVPNGTTPKIQNAMIEHCELLKDRFAVLDPIQGSDLNEIQKQRSLYDSKYVALYYPWIHIRSPVSGKTMSAPPSGHVCGIYARCDTERGVHKAPANEVVIGAVGLAKKISKNQQGILNPIGINCLREFSGRGIRVWGARTVSSDPTWKYVNVRRLLLYLEESIEKGIQWFVFEPNDQRLWASVKQAVTQFLMRVWKDGALMGTSPEEAFFVKCDRTTMTQNDIDNGRLIVLIGVAPLKPAEFTIFRVAQWKGGSDITE
jgi:phage tail sheath protein FI